MCQRQGLPRSQLPLYLLARFAALQQEVLGGCLAFIGTGGPDFYNNTVNPKFDLASVRYWMGVLPTYDANNNPIKQGKGVLGSLPFEVGIPATNLNPLCVDYASGYRLPGLFQTDTNEYDGTPQKDKNGYLIDIGSYVHVVADMQMLSNNYGYQYFGNLAGVIAGKQSSMTRSWP